MGQGTQEAMGPRRQGATAPGERQSRSAGNLQSLTLSNIGTTTRKVTFSLGKLPLRAEIPLRNLGVSTTQCGQTLQTWWQQQHIPKPHLQLPTGSSLQALTQRDPAPHHSHEMVCEETPFSRCFSMVWSCYAPTAPQAHGRNHHGAAAGRYVLPSRQLLLDTRWLTQTPSTEAPADLAALAVP